MISMSANADDDTVKFSGFVALDEAISISFVSLLRNQE